jgi:nitroimidazol reductase NimA-like FMN-containing flavoprotein (pyridoxamine 5'-phosphate oxidase superfamily)
LIHGIVDATPILHVAFNPAEPGDDPFPIVLPMLGCTGSFQDGQSTADETSIYLHGYVSARIMKLSGEDASRGLPITVSASILDGLVLSLTPFHNSCNYRSAVVFGYATVVTDQAEKLWALETITENAIPKRWENSRVPPSKTEITGTSILRVRIHTASAKVRTGEPVEDRKDLKDDSLRAKVWTGVVPSWLQWGEPVPTKENKVSKVPGYLNQWISEENSTGKDTAVAAATS